MDSFINFGRKPTSVGDVGTPLGLSLRPEDMFAASVSRLSLSDKMNPANASAIKMPVWSTTAKSPFVERPPQAPLNRSLPQNVHHVSHEASETIIRRKIRKETLAAYEISDADRVGILNSEQFEEFMIIMGFFTKSQMSICFEVCQKAFTFASELSKVVKIAGDHKNGNKAAGGRGSNWRHQEMKVDISQQEPDSIDISPLASGVTLAGAVAFLELVNDLQSVRHSGINELLSELRKRQLMNKRVNVKSSRRVSVEPPPAQKPQRFSETVIVSPETRELRRHLRWESVLGEVEQKEARVLTFKPTVGPAPAPRVGDRVQVVLADAGSQKLDHNRSGYGDDADEFGFSYNDHHFNGGFRGSDQSESESAGGCVCGYVTFVHRNGAMDVRCDNLMELTKVSPARVRKLSPTENMHANTTSNNNNTTVHDRLHSEPANTAALQPQHRKKETIYRRVDLRSSEERQLDLCSFQPRTNPKSPFVSERTLRQHLDARQESPPLHAHPTTPNESQNIPLGHQRRHRSPSPNARSRGEVAVDLTRIPGVGGMYIPHFGFIPGPPTAEGVPLFYFDPANPPSFEQHVYWETVVRRASQPSIVPSSSSSAENTSQAAPGVPPAPELPEWVLTGAPDPTRSAASNKIVISKRRKSTTDEPEAPAASGWQAVMAEMAARKNGTKALRKAAAASPPRKKKEEEEDAAMEQPPPGGFADIMDELKFKLNRRVKAKPATTAAIIASDTVAPDNDSNTDANARNESTLAVSDQQKTAGAGANKAGSIVAANEDGIVGGFRPATPAVDPSSIPLPPPLDESQFPQSLSQPSISSINPNSNNYSNNNSNNNTSNESTNSVAKSVESSSATASLATVVKQSEGEKNNAKNALLALFSRRQSSDEPSTSNAAPPTPPVSLPPPPGPKPPQNMIATSSHAMTADDAIGEVRPAMPLKPSLSSKSPQPPPLPRSWPPAPYANTGAAATGGGTGSTTGANTNQLANSSLNNNPASGVSIKRQLPLPTGYFQPNPQPATGVVTIAPGHIHPAGNTSQALIDSILALITEAKLKLQPNDLYGSDDLDGNYNSHFDAATGATNVNATVEDPLLEGRMAISDLPLPPNFYGSIQRLRRAKQVREEAKALEDSLAMRNYHSTPSKALPGGVLESPKVKEPTVPKPVVFASDLRNEKKDYSFRKPQTEPSPADRLPLGHGPGRNFKPNAAMAPYGCHQNVTAPNAHWITNLRNHHNKSENGETKLGDATGNTNAVEHSAFSTAASHDSNSTASEVVMTRGGLVKTYGKHPTKAVAPKLASDVTVSQRQSKREEARQLLERRQQEAARAEKARKEQLRQRAIQTAQSAGVYEPGLKLSYVDKLVAKYAMVQRHDVAGMAVRARDEYFARAYCSNIGGDLDGCSSVGSLSQSHTPVGVYDLADVERHVQFMQQNQRQR